MAAHGIHNLVTVVPMGVSATGEGRRIRYRTRAPSPQGSGPSSVAVDRFDSMQPRWVTSSTRRECNCGCSARSITDDNYYFYKASTADEGVAAPARRELEIGQVES